MLAVSERRPLKLEAPVGPPDFSRVWQDQRRRQTDERTLDSLLTDSGFPPSPIDIVGESNANRFVPTNGPAIMLPPDQWDSVLSRARGTIYRNTERISSNALLNLLEVGPDQVTRQRIGKRLIGPMRRLGWTGPRAMRIPAENGHAAGSSGYWRLPSRLPQPDMNVECEVDTSQSDDSSPET